jgi:site-specific DNA-methyltransferase (adenine-specific)
MAIQFFKGDCLEVMKTLPDKSVDLFLCDLPYGCLTGGGGKEKAKRGDGNVIGGCAWDIKIDLVAFWVQVKRLCRNEHTPVIHFCSTKFGFDLIASNPDWFRYDLVWSKSRAVGFLLANKMPMRSHELIYVFSKKGANYTRVDLIGDFPESVREGHIRSKQTTVGIYGKDYKDVSTSNKGKRCVKSVIDCPSEINGGKHPTQKPADLYAWLIERYSKEGDTILDPTAGSFASCFKAEAMGRKAIGIEMDEGFYDKAVALLPKVI